VPMAAGAAAVRMAFFGIMKSFATVVSAPAM
jgi:hypothetical protein